MNRDDLREFAARDWAATERSKRRYWQDRYRREGGAPARRASTALFEHARRLGVILTEPERARDLAHHRQLRELLDRAGRALARR